MYEPRHVGRIYGRACLAIDDGHAADIPPDILRELFPRYIDGLHRLTDPGRALAKAQREHERAHPTPPGEDTERVSERIPGHTLAECPCAGGDCGMIHDDLPQLWAVHVKGPVEIVGPFEIVAAVPSRKAAEDAAKGINAKAGTAPNLPAVTANAVPWPGTPEEHAADLGGWELEVADDAEATRAAGTSGGER